MIVNPRDSFFNCGSLSACLLSPVFRVGPLCPQSAEVAVDTAHPSICQVCVHHCRHHFPLVLIHMHSATVLICHVCDGLDPDPDLIRPPPGGGSQSLPPPLPPSPWPPALSRQESPAVEAGPPLDPSNAATPPAVWGAKFHGSEVRHRICGCACFALQTNFHVQECRPPEACLNCKQPPFTSKF